MRACSFHAESLPFNSAADVVALWATARPELTAPAGCAGCPRSDATGCAGPELRAQVRVYSAFASNNSGSYTLLGTFQTSERAAEIAALLTRLAADMEAAGEANPLHALLAAAGIPANEAVGKTDDWPAEWSSPPEAVQVGQQVWWYSAYTVTMPPELGHWFYAMGGRVQVELDHAHHPLLAQLSLWPDRPWKERQGVPRQPLIDALWLGPLAADDRVARVRTNDCAGIEVLWLGPEPEQMRELVRTATQLGLKCRLTLSELPGPKADLDSLW